MKKVLMSLVLVLVGFSVFAEVKAEKYTGYDGLPYTVFYIVEDHGKVYENFSWKGIPNTCNGKTLVDIEDIDVGLFIRVLGVDVKGGQHMKTVLTHKMVLVEDYDKTISVYYRWNYKGQNMATVATYR